MTDKLTCPIDPALIQTYQSAIRANHSADEHLAALLVAQYGKKRAGDMRYRAPETVEIGLAMRAKLEASEQQRTAWLATMNYGA